MAQFNWSPGIGDPTIGGWVTVVLYFLAMTSCWVTSRKLDYGQQERRIWSSIAILFLGLGINKQLDIQTAFTDAGRIIAMTQGWYGERREVQFVFIIFITIICLIALIILLAWARRAPAPTWFAFFGTTLVIGFVIIRAASFHHIDEFLGKTVLGFRWNWILEMGGISVVLIASQWRQKAFK
jgi:hypothetical protein